MKIQLYKSWFFLVALGVTIVLWGEHMGRRDSLVLSVFVALCIIWLFLTYADLRLAPHLHAQPLEGQDPFGLGQQVRQICASIRLPEPQIMMMAHETPQALSIGRNPKSGKIFVTEGLLRKLTASEMRAVLTYNLICIQQGSTLSFSLAGAMAEALLALGYLGDHLLHWLFAGSKKHPDKKKGQEHAVHFFSLLLAPLAGVLIRLAIGKKPYIQADQAVLRIMGEGQSLAQALWKLQSYAETQPLPLTLLPAAHFFIVNPLTMTYWGRYFHVQPRVAERIKNLVGHFPV